MKKFLALSVPFISKQKSVKNLVNGFKDNTTYILGKFPSNIVPRYPIDNKWYRIEMTLSEGHFMHFRMFNIIYMYS